MAVVLTVKACWCWVALLHQPITGAELVMLEQVAGISVELEQDWITSNVVVKCNGLLH